MCVAYLFKLKVYLCCSLSPITGLDAVLWEQTERQMDAWYTSLLELVRAESLDPGVHACLFTQWSSLVLLYRAISLREGRRKVLDDAGRGQQLPDTHVLYVEIKRSWSIVVKVVKELQQSGQLRYVGDAGLWALLPSIVAVRESLFTWPHRHDPLEYRRMYADVLSVLLSQRDQFHAVEAAIPLLMRELPTSLDLTPHRPQMKSVNGHAAFQFSSLPPSPGFSPLSDTSEEALPATISLRDLYESPCSLQDSDSTGSWPSLPSISNGDVNHDDLEATYCRLESDTTHILEWFET